jgi:integrase
MVDPFADGQITHLLSLLGSGRKRPFAVEMLAGIQSGHPQLMVRRKVRQPRLRCGKSRTGKAGQTGEYFFWSGSGNPKSCVGDRQRTLRRLGAIAGVHIHAHRWRHTFATQLLSKGVPVSEVAAILGNSPRIIEKHYSQWISSRQESVNLAVKGTWD